MSLVFPRYRVGPLYHLRAVWSLSRVKKPTSVGFFTSGARLSGLSGLVMPVGLSSQGPSLRGLRFSPEGHKILHRVKKMPLMETRQRLHTAILDSLRSFPHVIVLSATRRIRARLSGLSELFLNNCRVVSASLMWFILVMRIFTVKIKIIAMRIFFVSH